MAITQVINGNSVISASYSAATTSYCTIGYTRENQAEVTQANTQITYRAAGNFSNLQIVSNSNSLSGTCVLTLQVNGSDTALTISIPAASTGLFANTSNVVSVNSGDNANYKVVTGAGSSILLCSYGLCFSATLGTRSKWCTASTVGLSMSTDGTTFGYMTYIVQTPGESEVQSKISQSLKWSNLATYISLNTRTTTTTVVSRVNGVNGNQTLFIPTLTSGAFEDTTNSDQLVNGSLINYQTTLATGSGALVFQYYASEASSFDSRYTLMSNDNGNNSSSQNYWMGITGTNFQTLNSSEETFTQTALRGTCILSNLVYNIISNTAVLTSDTLTLRKKKGLAATSNTALQVVVPGSTTGQLEDASHFIPFNPTDLLSYEIDSTVVSGSYQPRAVTLLVNVTSNSFIYFGV